MAVKNYYNHYYDMTGENNEDKNNIIWNAGVVNET